MTGSSGLGGASGGQLQPSLAVPPTDPRTQKTFRLELPPTDRSSLFQAVLNLDQVGVHCSICSS